MGCGVPRYVALPASARNSRRREYHATMMLASTPNSSCATIMVMKYPGPVPRSVRKTMRSTKNATTRARNTTNVFTTPCSNVIVTMSPLATCATSWPSTASISSCDIELSSPVETATSAELRKAPVANALASPSYTATSGMLMPALSASFLTAATSHASPSLAGVWITCAPVVHFAIDFDMSSEMIAPVKPMTAEYTSSAPGLSPLAASIWFRPSALVTTLSTSITAMLVTRNRKMRFMDSSVRLAANSSAHSQRGGRWHSCALPGACLPALAPGIAQRDRAVEHRVSRTGLARVGDEVAVALELVARLRQGLG